ncbi:MAG: NYN domain-containing protein, partial [Armatimonadota bacterium]
MARYAVFIDGGYLAKLLKGVGEPRIDFAGLAEGFRANDELLRTYYYHCAPYQSTPPTKDEQERKGRFDRFVAALEWVPRFQVRLGRLVRRTEADGTLRFEQKMVDVLLTVDLVRLSSERQIRRAVIIAGDSDFVPAIEAAKDAGVIVQLCHGGDPRPHDQLLRVCDDRLV